MKLFYPLSIASVFLFIACSQTAETTPQPTVSKPEPVKVIAVSNPGQDSIEAAKKYEVEKEQSAERVKTRLTDYLAEENQKLKSANKKLTELEAEGKEDQKVKQAEAIARIEKNISKIKKALRKIDTHSLPAKEYLDLVNQMSRPAMEISAQTASL